MKDESTELNTQPAPADDEGNEIPRRHFFGNLAGVVGTTAAIGALGLTAKAQEQTQDKEIKSKILSRIQQQLKQEPGEEGLDYIKSDAYQKGGTYVKSDPPPVTPITE